MREAGDPRTSMLRVTLAPDSGGPSFHLTSKHVTRRVGGSFRIGPWRLADQID